MSVQRSLVYYGDAFDLQSFLSNLLFTNTGIPSEMHIPGYSFAGPGTKVNMRLGVDENKVRIPVHRQPVILSKPLNYMDEQARMHDIRYYNITNDANLTDSQKLAEKHKADEDIIRAVEKY